MIPEPFRKIKRFWAGADPQARVPELEWITRSGEEDEDDCYSAIEQVSALGGVDATEPIRRRGRRGSVIRRIIAS